MPNPAATQPAIGRGGEVSRRGLPPLVVAELLVALQHRCRINAVKTDDALLRAFCNDLLGLPGAAHTSALPSWVEQYFYSEVSGARGASATARWPASMSTLDEAYACQDRRRVWRPRAVEPPGQLGDRVKVHPVPCENSMMSGLPSAAPCERVPVAIGAPSADNSRRSPCLPRPWRLPEAAALGPCPGCGFGFG